MEQIGHEAYRLTVHDGIDVTQCDDYRDPDTAQQAYIDTQNAYLAVLAAFTLNPLPKRPAEIIEIEEVDV